MMRALSLFVRRCRPGAAGLALCVFGAAPCLAQLRFECDGTPALAGRTFALPPAEIGSESRCLFAIVNGGTAPQTVSSIDYPDGAIFVPPAERPALPRQLGSGERLTFNIAYRPTVPGPGNAAIVIGGQTIPLRGVGLVPRSRVVISPGGAVNPGEQVRASVALTSGFPGVDLTGTLSLEVAPNNATNNDDPATLFQNGARSATFTISGGTTQAVFANGQPDFGLQIGTVAADFTLRAQFFTSGEDVTSASAPASQAQVRRSAPVIREFVIEPSGQGFVLRATGFSTTREVSGVTVRLNPNAGAAVSPETYDLPGARDLFDQYYRSADGLAAGGQSVFRLQATFNGDRGALRSISMTMTNQAGQSVPVEAAFQ
jgi:hypothetical protein